MALSTASFEWFSAFEVGIICRAAGGTTPSGDLAISAIVDLVYNDSRKASSGSGGQ